MYILHADIYVYYPIWNYFFDPALLFFEVHYSYLGTPVYNKVTRIFTTFSYMENQYHIIFPEIVCDINYIIYYIYTIYIIYYILYGIWNV